MVEIISNPAKALDTKEAQRERRRLNRLSLIDVMNELTKRVEILEGKRRVRK